MSCSIAFRLDLFRYGSEIIAHHRHSVQLLEKIFWSFCCMQRETHKSLSVFLATRIAK